MRRIAASAWVLLVLGLGMAAAEAQAGPQAQASAFRSLETLTVPSNQSGKAPVITSRTPSTRTSS